MGPSTSQNLQQKFTGSLLKSIPLSTLLLAQSDEVTCDILKTLYATLILYFL